MFKTHSNNHEAGSAVRDTVLIVLTAFVASALIINMAASAITPLNADVHGVLMQTVSRVFLTLALTGLPLVICLIALPSSGRNTGSAKSGVQE